MPLYVSGLDSMHDKQSSQSVPLQMGLQLSKEQETEILTARHRMLTRLLALVDQRKSIISRLGLQMLQTGRVSCPRLDRYACI